MGMHPVKIIDAPWPGLGLASAWHTPHDSWPGVGGAWARQFKVVTFLEFLAWLWPGPVLTTPPVPLPAWLQRSRGLSPACPTQSEQRGMVQPGWGLAGARQPAQWTCPGLDLNSLARLGPGPSQAG